MPPKVNKTTASLTSSTVEANDQRNNMLEDIRRIVREVIQDEVSSLKTDIQLAIAPVRAELDECKTQLADHEEGLNTLAARIDSLEARCTQLAKDNAKLQLKMDDLENRVRRCNLLIVGIPEGVEQGNPIPSSLTCFTNCLPDRGGLEKAPVLDRAHCVPASRPKYGERPCSLLCKVHIFQVKEEILKLSRQKGKLVLGGTQIFIFPDYSADLDKRRAAYHEVKAVLRKADVRYGLLYPARLRITFGSETRIFDSPQSAMEYYTTKIKHTAENM
ncbi:LINE-1 type transposase domain containing protein 1 [Dissostichus eleginoides]|uniref:LINE-1 type transposase domain containing protein 1 n=1 Tax=Dissostichus eleginoides TaxID=100907 RepID=A0AAD9CR32_DISEL|nr:LINE-1 type transposase domain containing protein 1 [Dissostichus eleginoides]